MSDESKVEKLARDLEALEEACSDLANDCRPVCFGHPARVGARNALAAFRGSAAEAQGPERCPACRGTGKERDKNGRLDDCTGMNCYGGFLRPPPAATAPPPYQEGTFAVCTVCGGAARGCNCEGRAPPAPPGAELREPVKLVRRTPGETKAYHQGRTAALEEARKAVARLIDEGDFCTVQGITYVEWRHVMEAIAALSVPSQPEKEDER